MIALEEKQLPYNSHLLSFSNNETHTGCSKATLACILTSTLAEQYLRINPRGKVPAIVDKDVTMYESKAILHYLEFAYPGV
jgi:glutathione S-transferase